MKKIIKNLNKNIILWTATFILVMESISLVLKCYNYQLLNWIKYTSMIISFVGILLGTIQSLKKKRTICVILCILEGILIGTINLALIISYNNEKIVVKENKKMIQETHSFLFSNWIKYYDYKNIFVRSTQERIYEAHDDYIGEYLYIIYYDEDGKCIKWEE